MRDYLCWRTNLCPEQSANEFYSSNLLTATAIRQMLRMSGIPVSRLCMGHLHTYKTAPRYIPSTSNLELRRRESIKWQYAKLYWRHCRLWIFLNSTLAVHNLHPNPVSILKFTSLQHFHIFRLGLEASLFKWVYLDFSVIQKYCIVWIIYFTFTIKSVLYFIPEGVHSE